MPTCQQLSMFLNQIGGRQHRWAAVSFRVASVGPHPGTVRRAPPTLALQGLAWARCSRLHQSLCGGIVLARSRRAAAWQNEVGVRSRSSGGGHEGGQGLLPVNLGGLMAADLVVARRRRWIWGRRGGGRAAHLGAVQGMEVEEAGMGWRRAGVWGRTAREMGLAAGLCERRGWRRGVGD
uniref:Uncharacterized protein n=1 Tax=Arundo donax TaxID=35708 RepID=A0A0A9GCE2_ARUDO